jgi:hypothetical protein
MVGATPEISNRWYTIKIALERAAKSGSRMPRRLMKEEGKNNV